MNKRMVFIGVIAVALSASPAFAENDPAEAREIAKEAYIYGFPMVDSYLYGQKIETYQS
jgi:hypothetical protein